MKLLSGAVSPLLVLVLASCTGLGETRWAAHEAPEATMDTVAVGREQATPQLGVGFASNLASTFADTDDDGLPDNRLPVVEAKARKMIYSASLQVRVSSIDDAVRKFLARVGQLEGYLAQRNNNVLTCRIPARSFQTFIAEVKEYGTVLQESMRAQDVTKKHLDLSIRLENAETARQRLLKLLEKATKVEDILKIEEQLTRLTETIERIKGELKFLNEQVAYSLVEVGFHSVSPTVRPSKKRSRSRFSWINQVGIEQVLRRF
ncbi:MAG: DUF4349 domain-containing protein [Planctomycetota bacterium]|jgi:hypothetical protein